MKNSFKIGAFALAISVSALACDFPKSDSGKTTIDTPKKSVDTTKKVTVDTTKKDTTKKM